MKFCFNSLPGEVYEKYFYLPNETCLPVVFVLRSGIPVALLHDFNRRFSRNSHRCAI